MTGTTRNRYWLVAGCAILLGIALHHRSIAAGYAADDYLQMAMIERWFPVSRSPLDLYRFVDADRGELPALMDRGTMPWWSDPGLKIATLRPLSSSLIFVDHAWLKLGPDAKHIHSFLWWVAAVSALALVLRRWLPPAAAAVAVIAFAVSPAHVLPLAWLANRAALVSAATGFSAMWAHARWREDGWRPGAWMGPALFALSLLGGEYALGVGAYLVAYEWLQGTGSIRRRFLAVLPHVLLATGYVIAGAALGYGADGSAIYVDPLRSPVTYLRAAATRFPSLVLMGLLGLPAPPSTPLGLLVGLAGIAAVVVAARPVVADLAPPARRAVVALAAGSLLSIVPLLATAPDARLLVVPNLGGATVIAVLVHHLMQQLRGCRLPHRGRRLGAAAAAVVLAAVHLVVAPLRTARESAAWRRLLDTTRERLRRADVDDSKVARQHVVLVNALHLFNVVYPPYVRERAGSPMPASWRVLATTPYAVGLSRIDEHTIELRSTEAGFFEDPTAVLFRSPQRPLAVGDRVRIAGVDITVQEIAERGPRRVRYEFDEPIDDDALAFLVVTGRGLSQLDMPGIGETTLLRTARGAAL